jgi:hypothetical protein
MEENFQPNRFSYIQFSFFRLFLPKIFMATQTQKFKYFIFFVYVDLSETCDPYNGPLNQFFCFFLSLIVMISNCITVHEEFAFLITFSANLSW